MTNIGNTDNQGSGGYGITVHKRNMDGYWLSGPTFGGVKDEFGTYITLDNSNRLLMVGKSNSYSELGDADLYLVRFPNDEVIFDYVLDLQDSECFTVDIDKNDNEPEITREGNEIRINDGSIDLYTIFGVDGKVVKGGENLSPSDVVNIEELSPGIYFLRLQTGFGNQIVYSFLKN